MLPLNPILSEAVLTPLWTIIVVSNADGSIAVTAPPGVTGVGGGTAGVVGEVLYGFPPLGNMRFEYMGFKEGVDPLAVWPDQRRPV